MGRREMPVYDIADFEFQGSESDFYANTFADHLLQHEHMVYAPHRHQFYLSMLFTRGNGTHEIDFQTFDIKPGSVFLLSPGQVHSWEVSDDIMGYILFHKKEFFDLNFSYEKVEHFPFFGGNQNLPVIQLDLEDAAAFSKLFLSIVTEYHTKYQMHLQKISSLLSVLYIDLSRRYIPDRTSNGAKELNLAHVRKLMGLIEQNFREEKSPAKYARSMFMSGKNLNVICKIILHKTVSEVIAERVILEAKRLLIHTSMNIAEISFALGYTDNSYFSRIFKRKTGVTALEFRQNYRKQREIGE